jgi:hypothetical protein
MAVDTNFGGAILSVTTVRRSAGAPAALLPAVLSRQLTLVAGHNPAAANFGAPAMGSECPPNQTPRLKFNPNSWRRLMDGNKGEIMSLAGLWIAIVGSLLLLVQQLSSVGMI